MTKTSILILLACLLIFRVSAQSWDYEKLKTFFSKSKPSTIEGFFELDSDRKYLVGVVKNGQQYDIIYLFGESQYWTEGDVKGFIEKKDSLYIAKWDGSVKPATTSFLNLKIKYDPKGFTLQYDGDTPDYFKRITTSEIEMTRKKYISGKSIKMIQTKSGVFEIPASINNVLIIYLILDIGASEVSISPDVVLTLIKAKAIKDEDWLEGKYYRFADGSIAKSERFIIRNLKIGGFEIKDVEASISSSIVAPLLLGQSALSKFGKIQIDYKTQEFKILD